MPFKKGQSGNPKGKAKGTISKKTAMWHEIGDWFVGDGIEAYKSNLVELLTHENVDVRLKAMDKFNALIEFFKPKLSRSEIKGDIDAKITNTEIKIVQPKDGD